MSEAISDTSVEAEEVQLSLLRKLGPRRRSELTAQWSDEMRRITMQGIRDRHPELNERQVVVEFARLTLDESLWREAFGAEATLLEKTKVN